MKDTIKADKKKVFAELFQVSYIRKSSWRSSKLLWKEGREEGHTSVTASNNDGWASEVDCSVSIVFLLIWVGLQETGILLYMYK